MKAPMKLSSRAVSFPGRWVGSRPSLAMDTSNLRGTIRKLNPFSGYSGDDKRGR